MGTSQASERKRTTSETQSALELGRSLTLNTGQHPSLPENGPTQENKGSNATEYEASGDKKMSTDDAEDEPQIPTFFSTMSAR